MVRLDWRAGDNERAAILAYTEATPAIALISIARVPLVRLMRKPRPEFHPVFCLAPIG